MPNSTVDDHSRTIIHIDIDCFYAQVEMNKNPTLRTQPMGVKQKSFIVTSNLPARELGVHKCMFVADALKLCPELVLVNGEDLHDYRQVSYRITEMLHQYSNLVERLGLDENFIDVSKLVEEKQRNGCDVHIVGNIFGDSSEKCDCGCTERLSIGSTIAQDIRDMIKHEFNLTTCAGVAHNKILAKLVGKTHKPNAQTIVFPNSALELLLSLETVDKIPGIGRTLCEQLAAIHISTVQQLQDCDLKQLEQAIGVEKARTLYNYSYGIDPSVVKTTGKPQTIGLEDSYSCKSICMETEVKSNLSKLLTRLLILVKEDGRIPKTIKLTVRKLDKATRTSQRETKQCNITFNPDKIMTTVMHLFNRIVDVKKAYHITLLGLAFTKFQEPPRQKNTIASFLRKSLEVQSVTSIEQKPFENSMEIGSPIPSTSPKSTDSPTPSPKKLKLANLVTKKRCFEDSFQDCESPSKLKVADLRLDAVACPNDVDKDVFKELPTDIQKELWDDFQRRREMSCGKLMKKPKPNTLLNYFIKNNS